MKTNTVKKLKELSIFYPCYNEEDNIPTLMKETLRILPTVAEKYEVILVNDGSKDRTSEIAHEYANKYPFVRVIDQKNSGYGGAVRTGMAAAKYEWVFFTDADLQFKLIELKRFVKNVSSKTDMVIGFRKTRAEGFKRALFAKGMKVWNSVLLGFPTEIKDIDCAFKLINKKVIDSVGPLNSTGNLVSSEFLLRSHKLGFRIKQLGVDHFNRVAGESTCGGLKDIIKVLEESFALFIIMHSSTAPKATRILFAK